MMRDRERERSWLEHAELAGGRSGFVEHALGRLSAGDSAYGDRWAQLDVDQLLIELAEEAADLGSWGVLALQALDCDQGLSAATRGQLATRLERTLALGARAHHELARARLELKRATAPPGRPFMPDVDGRCLDCARGYVARPRSQCRPCVGEADASEGR